MWFPHTCGQMCVGTCIHCTTFESLRNSKLCRRLSTIILCHFSKYTLHQEHSTCTCSVSLTHTLWPCCSPTDVAWKISRISVCINYVHTNNSCVHVGACKFNVYLVTGLKNEVDDPALFSIIKYIYEV